MQQLKHIIFQDLLNEPRIASKVKSLSLDTQRFVPPLLAFSKNG